MKVRKWFIPILFVCILFKHSNATNYYFSSINGMDSNSGTESGQALQSIAKMQEILDAAQAGDKILLERGSVWEDATISIVSKTDVTLTAYGTGKAPIISGYKILTNPVDNGDHTYTYSDPKIQDDYRKSFLYQDFGSTWYACNLNFLLIDDKPYDMGRHPNGKSYYDAETVNQSGYKSWFTETDKTWDNGYWDGAQIKIFPEHWVPEDIRVRSYLDNTFNLNTADWNSGYDLKKQNISYATGVKYYIFNHRNALDKDGEWCLDRENQTITVYSSIPLSDKEVKQSFNDTVISIAQCTNLRVSNIEFWGGKKFTLNLVSSSRVDIDSCVLRYTPIYAAFVDNNYFVSFQYDSIIDATSQGIFLHSNYGETVKYCYGRNIGVSEGVGGDRDNYSFRFINSHQRDGGLTYEYNQIDSFGYAAIGVFLPNMPNNGAFSIKYNHMKNGPMLLTDAAAFYCSGDWTDVIKEVKYNVVEDIYSNTGNSWNSSGLSMGLYLDVDAENFELDSNTIVGAQYGIYLNGTNHNNMRYNHITHVSKTGMVGKASGYGHNGVGTLYCNYLNNVSVAGTSNATGFEWYYGSLFSGGGTVVDSNAYYNPYRTVDISIGRYSNWTQYPTSMESWRTTSGWETHSTYNKNGYKNNPLEVNPAKCVKTLWNLSGVTRSVDLKDCEFVDLDGNEVSGSVEVEPYYSQILFLTSGDSVDFISDGVIDYSYGGITAVDEVKNENIIHCFPVPAGDYINLRNIPINSCISVYDLMGARLQEMKNYNADQIQVNLNGYKTGIYLFKVNQANHKTQCFKVIKN